MAKVVTVEQMRQIERTADAAGHTYERMMELAGFAVAQELMARVDQVEGTSMLVLAGSGNNGGDALVAADLLADAEAQVVVYLTKPRSDDDPLLAKLRERGMLIAVAEQDQRSRVLKLQLGKAAVVVDGVLGTGIELPLRGEAQEVLKAAKGALAQRPTAPFVLAVDCPSGVDCDSGAAAPEALDADVTVTFAAAKLGQLRFPAASLVGELVVADIGIPAKDLDHIETDLATAESVREWLPARPLDAHKGTFGRALVVGGCRNYPGAVLLAAEAAYLAGAGLVTCAVPESIQAMLVARLPEATWIPLPEEQGAIGAGAVELLAQVLPDCSSLLLGPGFGLAPGSAQFIEQLIAGDSDLPPMVVDADGLKHLAGIANWPDRLPEHTVLTPHPGEMSVLTGRPTDEIQADRLAAAREHAGSWGRVLVLKGAHTVVAEPGGRATIQPFATPALARAGTGDVLAGIIAGLMAQGLGAYQAAVLGGYLHGTAGVLAAEELGTSVSVVAGDLNSMLPQVFWELGAG